MIRQITKQMTPGTIYRETPTKHRYVFAPVCLAALIVMSCTTLYFSRVDAPLSPLRFDTIMKLPYRELWHGFIFNGEKVGFTYLKFHHHDMGHNVLITSRARLRIPFMGMRKEIHMKSEDVVRPDLSLVSFHYEQTIDDRNVTIKGSITNGTFRAAVTSDGVTKVIEKRLQTPVYPVSAINLYPVVQGIAPGRTYHFTVFDPQTRSFTPVSQTMLAYERSGSLSVEPSFKIKTCMHEHEVFTWINRRGEPVFELGMGGILVTAKESEEDARRFLLNTGLNKKDIIYDFSLIKPSIPLACPRMASFLAVRLEGIEGHLPLLQGPGQEVTMETCVHSAPVFRIHSDLESPVLQSCRPLSARDHYLYTASTGHIDSAHPQIKSKSAELLTDISHPFDKIQVLTQWVSANVKDEVVDYTSASEVLAHLTGECQAHTMLYAALARAAGIPTKPVAGLVYIGGLGFLYHSWAESYLAGWIAVDPTFNQVGTDATHIKLVEGPFWTSIFRLGKVIGRLGATILEYHSPCATYSAPP